MFVVIFQILLMLALMQTSRGGCPSLDQFACANGLICLRSAMYVCDGDNDCQDNSDEIACHTEFQDNFLVVADATRKNLYQVGISTGGMSAILPPLATTNPVAVVIDPTNRDIYWTDVLAKTIKKYSPAAGSQRITQILSDPLGAAVYDGLALDAGRRKLYYSDAGDPTGKLGEMNTDGTQLRILASGVGAKPRAIVLDEQNRQLYYTDWGTSPGIRRINIDTLESTTIISTGLMWPNGLAIDFTERVMFWADSHYDKIEKSNLDGTGRTVLVLQPGDHYFGLALSPQYLYVTDWAKRFVLKFDRRSSVLSAVPPTAFGQLMGVAYYNSSFKNQAASGTGSSSSTLNSTVTSSATTATTFKPSTTTPTKPVPLPTTTTTTMTTTHTQHIPLPSSTTITSSTRITKTTPTSTSKPVVDSNSSLKPNDKEESATTKTAVIVDVAGQKASRTDNDESQGKSEQQIADGSIKIDHSMIIIICVVVGGVIAMTCMIAVAVCVVTKMRRERSRSSSMRNTPSVKYETNNFATLARCQSDSSKRASNTYDCIDNYTSLGSGTNGRTKGECGYNGIEDDSYLNPICAQYDDEHECYDTINPNETCGY